MERRIALSSRSTCVLPVRTLVNTLIPRDVGISSTSAGRAIVPRRVYGVQPREVAGGAVGWRGNWGGDCCWEKGWLRSRKKRWSAQLVENNIEEKEESGEGGYEIKTKQIKGLLRHKCVSSTTYTGLGSAVGVKVGSNVGVEVGSNVGIAVGSSDGAAVGSIDGLSVGGAVGAIVGSAVGRRLGGSEGNAVGPIVGMPEGM